MYRLQRQAAMPARIWIANTKSESGLIPDVLPEGDIRDKLLGHSHFHRNWLTGIIWLDGLDAFVMDEYTAAIGSTSAEPLLLQSKRVGQVEICHHQAASFN